MTDRREEPHTHPERDGEQELALYLEGALDPEATAAFEERLRSDDDLAEELYSQLQLREALRPAVAAAAAPSPRRSPAPRHRFSPALTAALVASLAVVVVLLPRFRGGDDGSERVLRGESATTQLLEARTVDGALRLRWTASPGAARYRVELLDSGGMVLHSVLRTDTLLVLDPAPPALATRWRVVPLDAVGAPLPAPPAQRLR